MGAIPLRIWTEEEIEKLTPAEYAAAEAELRVASRQGRITPRGGSRSLAELTAEAQRKERQDAPIVYESDLEAMTFAERDAVTLTVRRAVKAGNFISKQAEKDAGSRKQIEDAIRGDASPEFARGEKAAAPASASPKVIFEADLDHLTDRTLAEVMPYVTRAYRDGLIVTKERMAASRTTRAEMEAAVLGEFESRKAAR